MKNLENNIRPIYDRVVGSINTILSFREIVSEYSVDVDATVDKLCNMDKSESGEVFREIAKGLKGELTREKATNLGKKVITLYMKDIADACLKDIEELYKQPSVSMNIVKINSDTLGESTEIEALNDIMKIIKSEQLRLEYLGRKADSLIGPHLAGEVSTQSDVPTFLAVTGNMLKTMNYESGIPKAITDYNIHKKTSGVIKGFVTNMIKNNTVEKSEVESMISQLDEHKLNLVDVETNHAHIVDCVNKAATVTLDNELYELYTEMHDNLSSKMTAIGTDTKMLDANINKIKNLDMLTSLLNEYVKVIEDYFKGEMTLDVMMAATNVYGVMIADSTNALVKLLNIANAEITEVNNNINIINQVYDIDSEVLNAAALSRK